jgi:hypothetical protein
MDEVYMHSSNSAAATVEAGTVEFRINPLDHPDLDNIVVSPCGMRIESFDSNGHHFVIDWEELVGDEDEDEGMPHEEFMAELDRYIEELLARREAGK